MELTWWQMYLIIKGESFADGLGFFAFILLLLSGFILAIQWFADGVPAELIKIKAARWMMVAILGLTVSTGVPSKEEIALMWFIPAIVNNQDVQSIPPELAKLARIKLEEMTKEAIK